MKLFKGSAVALITPMKNHQVNLELFESLINWHINHGTQALIISGTTGESATLSRQEKLQVFQRAVQVSNGKIPIIANTGTNNTIESVMLSKEAEKLGVDGILAVTPYYNKPSQKGMFEHFKAISDSINIPIILYNVPSRTAVHLELNTIVALAKEKNIIGIKEASADLTLVKNIVENTPRDFALYSGNDDLYLETLKLGADGVISVVANIDPNTSQSLYETLKNNPIEARKIQAKLKVLNDVLYLAPNPVPVKTALHILGLDTLEMRLPLIEMDAPDLKTLSNALNTYQLESINL